MGDPILEALSELIPVAVRRGELRRDGRWLRWVEAGEGRPPVVVVGGLGEPGSLAWAGVLSAVAARTRIIAYDRAGLGASDATPDQTLEDQVADQQAHHLDRHRARNQRGTAGGDKQTPSS